MCSYMLKLTQGSCWWRGGGWMGKEKRLGNTVWPVSPLPCLPSFTSHQPSGPLKASGDFAGSLLPRPGGPLITPRRKSTPLRPLHGSLEDTALQMEFLI